MLVDKTKACSRKWSFDGFKDGPLDNENCTVDAPHITCIYLLPSPSLSVADLVRPRQNKRKETPKQLLSKNVRLDPIL